METFVLIAVSFVLGEIVGVVIIVALQGTDRLRGSTSDEPLPFPWPPEKDQPAASDEPGGLEGENLYKVPAFLRRQAD